MNAKLEALAGRQAQLILCSDSLRDELAVHYSRFARPVRTAEKTLSVVNLLKMPIALLGFGALLFRTRLRKLGRLPKLIWRGWKIVSALNRTK